MKLFRLQILIGSAALVLAAEYAPEHSRPAASTSAPSAGNAPATEHGNASSGGLTIGAVASDSLRLGAITASQRSTDAAAVQQLEKLRSPEATTDRLAVYNLLKDLLDSSASEENKDVARKETLRQLAITAEELGDSAQALQLWAEYVKRYPADILVPEVLLKQGVIERKLGAYETAKSKFHDVVQASLWLGSKNQDYASKVTLAAMDQIAETAFVAGDYPGAADYYTRLLNQDDTERLNLPVIRLKLIRSLAKGSQATEPGLAGSLRERLIREATRFISEYTMSEHQPEVRYLLAKAYKAKGDTQESLEQVSFLLEAIEAGSTNMAEIWKQWKMLAGNDIGNELFNEGDYLNALLVYNGLAAIDSSPAWRLPLYYQIGLCYENLKQNPKAIEAYGQIVKTSQEPGVTLTASLKLTVDLARWRHERLTWVEELSRATRRAVEPVAPAAPAATQ